MLSSQWTFKLISAPAAAEKWHLRGCMLTVKVKNTGLKCKDQKKLRCTDTVVKRLGMEA